MIYTGINSFEQQSKAFDDGAARERLRQDDAMRKRTGGMIADGDIQGASNEMLRFGNLDGGMNLRTTYRDETQAGINSSALKEMIASRNPAALPAQGGANASSQIAMPNYGSGAVASEAMPEMGAGSPAAATGGASAALSAFEGTASGQQADSGTAAPAPAQDTASGALSSNLSAEGKAAFAMRQKTGGELSADAYFQAANRMLAGPGGGDLQGAIQMMNLGMQRAGLENQLDFKNQSDVALRVVKDYNGMDAEEKKMFGDEVRNNKALLASAPDDVIKMLLDGKPENDARAMEIWAGSYGIDPGSRHEDDQYDLDEGRRQKEARFDGDLDFSNRSRELKLEARYEEGGDLYKGPATGGGARFSIPENTYGVAPAGELGSDGTFWAPGLSTETPGVKQGLMKAHNDALEMAETQASAEGERSSLLMGYVQILNDKKLWDKLGSGTSEFLQRQFSPTEFQDLNVKTEELVRAERKATKGIFTDDDARQARQLGANDKLSGGAIKAMMEAQIAVANRANEEVDFYYQYTNLIGGIGTVDRAKYIWRQYEKENPFLTVQGDQIVPNGGYKEFYVWYPSWEASQEANSATPEERAAAAGYD